MNTVYVYGFIGEFSGSSEYEYRTPEAGKEIKCILLLSQQSKNLDFEKANKEIKKYGFINVHSLEGNLLKVEALNSSNGAKFQPYYHEALKEGSSLAIY